MNIILICAKIKAESDLLKVEEIKKIQVDNDFLHFCERKMKDDFFPFDLSEWQQFYGGKKYVSYILKLKVVCIHFWEV